MKNKFYTFYIKIFLILIILSNASLADVPIYELFGTKIIFNSEKNIVSAEGNASAIDKFGKKILSDKIIYDKEKSQISTFSNSIYTDRVGNTIKADKFIYQLNLKKIKAQNNVQYFDKEGNKFYFSELEYNESLEKGIGNNFRGILIDKSSLEGKFAEFDNKLGLLTIGTEKEKNILEKIFSVTVPKENYYTSCENKEDDNLSIKERCPDWSINTEKTIHDRKKQIIKHYGSVIKIKDIPVFYTPYFSHPDPSVKRKSGFLPPSLKNFTDLGQTIKTPYFYVLDEFKDITFTPIYYFNENPIFLAEYRQQNANGKFFIDTSYTKGYKNLNKLDSNGTSISRTNGSRNHFFFNFLGNYEDLIYNKNDLEINIQRISQKNYLNVNQINTENVKQDIINLNNNIILNSYEDNKKISIRTEIFENINIDNRNSKYQYTIPSIIHTNYIDKFNQTFYLLNSFKSQNLGGDSNKIYQNNRIEVESKPKQFAFNKSIANTFRTIINNSNSYNDNILNEKKNLNNDIYLTTSIESKVPLIKFSQNTKELITPKLFSKYTSGSMLNASSQNKIINASDIFSMNRMDSETNPDTGISLGYGVEYEKETKKVNTMKTKSNFFIGQVLRPDKLNQMPSNSTLADKRSSYVGSITYDHNLDDEINLNSKNNLKVNYEYIVSKDFNEILKNSIITEANINNNFLSLNYYKTHKISNDHYIDINYTKKLKNDFSYSFGGRKNIKDNFTENNYISADYDTDCIKISLNLAKTFYHNEELKPSNNFNFSITFKPFGSPWSPNLSNFLN